MGLASPVQRVHADMVLRTATTALDVCLSKSFLFFSETASGAQRVHVSQAFPVHFPKFRREQFNESLFFGTGRRNDQYDVHGVFAMTTRG